MRRIITAALLAGAIVSLVGAGGTASASPQAPAVRAPARLVPAVRGDVNAFRFESFSADYYLGLDSHRRTTLKTVETLVADFPETDQNHGILRALVTDYDGHPTDLHVVSVTDGDGAPRPFRAANDSEKSERDSGFYQLVSRSPDFVHGRQTYVITYTQHNVTRYFPNTHDDEFYWDTNGTGWNQPFDTVTARVHVAPALAKAFTQKAACYRGAEGSTAPCGFLLTAQPGGGLLLSASAASLGPRENLTIALGFTPGTIVPRDASFFASPVAPGLLLFAIVGLGAFVVTLILRRGPLADAAGRPTIIAEYLPPTGQTVLTDAVLLRKVDRASASQIIDLAVRGNIRLIETDGTGFFGTGTSFTLEFVKPDGLAADEAEFLRIFFGPGLEPTAQYTLVKSDTSRSRAVYRLISRIRSSLPAAGLVKRLPLGARALPVVLALVATVGSVISAFLMFGDSRGGVVPAAIAVAVVILSLIVLRVVGRSRVTAAGAERRDHLKGLELYIRLAEADRLRVLQSPAGADRVAVSTTDRREMLKLGERVLPYAVLFGLEKEWAKEIGKYYDESSAPEWYSGSGAFNAALFATGLSSFASATSSSFSGSSGSSSSGGSGGGGFSGGGGGGGGGGGV